MHDPAVFSVRNFRDAGLGARVGSDPAGIEDLPAAGGIEGASVEESARDVGCR